MCSERWISANDRKDPDKGRYVTDDCGRCSCMRSSAQHSPAYTNGENTISGRPQRYCTKCDEYY